METFKAQIAYDGTDFHGFQRQIADQRTVQGEFEAALGKLGWNGKSIKAAGRTDAGVHARGQVVSFDLSWRASEMELAQALNANLPPDIAVKTAEKADAEFHPRFSAVGRTYAYSIYLAPNRDPLEDRYAWRVWPEPNLNALLRAAGVLEGTHDFRTFGSAPSENGHTIRTVSETNWRKSDRDLTFTIEANAFLYHMVRRLVGALVAVGLDPQKHDEIERQVHDPHGNWSGTMAPARGLVLEDVRY